MFTFDDYKTNMLKDRMAGRWFATDRTSSKIWIETIGKGIALSLRTLLRKNIGVETFSFWNSCWAFLWIRICLVLNIFISSEFFDFTYFINPLLFSNLGTGLLNVFSLVLLASIFWYSFRPELPASHTGFVDVLNRGESMILRPLIKKDEWFFQKEGFVQSTIAPGLCFIMGGSFIFFSSTIGLGLFFMISSTALFIDEINYHRAGSRYDRIVRSKIFRTKQKYAGHDYDRFEDT